MKFRGEIHDPHKIAFLTEMTYSATKQHRLLVIRITNSRFYIQTRNLEVICIGSISKNSLFACFVFQGVSDEENEICLEINGLFLLRVLRSMTANTEKVCLRLSKGQMAELVFEIHHSHAGGPLRQVTHAIPVIVISRKHWDEIRCLDLRVPDISMLCPSVTILRRIVSRFMPCATDSYFIVVRGNKDGTITIASGVGSDIETSFKDLQLSTGVVPTRDESEVCVDIRRVALFLNSLTAQNSQILCKISHHSLLHLVYLHDDTSTELVLPHNSE